MACSNKKVGYHSVDASISVRKKEVGKPTPNAAEHCVKAQCCDHDGYKLDKLREGWAFRVGIWNVDSLTGRGGELMKVLANRRTDIACV